MAFIMEQREGQGEVAMSAWASNLTFCIQPCDLELGLCKADFSFANWLQIRSSNERH